MKFSKVNCLVCLIGLTVILFILYLCKVSIVMKNGGCLEWKKKKIGLGMNV